MNVWINKVVLECAIVCSTQCIDFWDSGTTDEDTTIRQKFHKRFSRPTILLENGGKMVQVSFNNQVRSCQLTQGKSRNIFRWMIFMNIDMEITKSLYEALKVFNTMCYSPDCLLHYRLRDGDCVVFDNLRVLHGRNGFTFQPAISEGRFAQNGKLIKFWSNMGHLQMAKMDRMRLLEDIFRDAMLIGMRYMTE